MLSKAGDQVPVMFSREIFKSVLGSPSHSGGICAKLVVVEFTIVISKLFSAQRFDETRGFKFISYAVDDWGV